MEDVDRNGLSSLAVVPPPPTPQRGKHSAMLEQPAGSTDSPPRRTTIRVIAPQKGCLVSSFLFHLFHASAARGTIKSENCIFSDIPSVHALDPRKWPLPAFSGTPSTRRLLLAGSTTDKQ